MCKLFIVIIFSIITLSCSSKDKELIGCISNFTVIQGSITLQPKYVVEINNKDMILVDQETIKLRTGRYLYLTKSRINPRFETSEEGCE